MAYREVRVVITGSCSTLAGRRWVPCRCREERVWTARLFVGLSVQRTVGLNLGIRPPTIDVAALIAEVKGSAPATGPGETERALFPYQDRSVDGCERMTSCCYEVHDLLGREGALVPYTSLHRFARNGATLAGRRRLPCRPARRQTWKSMPRWDFGRLGYLAGTRRRQTQGRYASSWCSVTPLSCASRYSVRTWNRSFRCVEEAFRFFGGCPGRIVIGQPEVVH